MWRTMLIALRVTIGTLILTGIIYPLTLTGLAQLLFPDRANGSLITDEHGAIVGSELIGQGFTTPAYFHPRPSSAGQQGYDATSSGGSNLGPTSKKLRDRVIAEISRLKNENPNAPLPVPAELVTASASGLDPHLSPEAAFWQVPRVARARGVAADRVRAIVEANVEGRDLYVLGEPRINVLLLNLSMDRHFGRSPR
jgi:potassium-transporting ATPase KdpC subunit